MNTENTDFSNKTKAFNFWKIAAIIILILAIVSRFYALGDRAVSHDEMTHAKFSWNLYTGQGFRHDPLMHGPLLFEATALIYALFGVSDFTARIYAALAGVALVMAPWLFQKWLGKRGALFASIMLLISPAITYYARYTRHDTPMMLAAMLLLWALLNYLDTGRARWLYGMAVFFPLMYASKENAYIYTLIFLVLLAIPFFWQMFRVQWAQRKLITLLAVVVIVALLAGGTFVMSMTNAQVSEIEDTGNTAIANISIPWWGRLALGIALLAVLSAVPVIYYGVGAETLRALRLFDVLMTLGTLTLPLGSAFLMKFVAGVDMSVFYPALMNLKFGAIPLNMTLAAFGTFAVVVALSIALGLWWDKKRWPIIALIHYGIFATLFSTFFTYGWGVMTGQIGGLAYWIAQQTENRGSQPWYYYTVIGPLYEYMPLLLSLVAGLWGFVRPVLRLAPPHPASSEERDTPQPLNLDLFFPLFLSGWAAMSWVAYSYAGEKMPWLFVHIALPHVLLAAWGLGQWLYELKWQDIAQRGWMLIVALPLLWKAIRAFGEAANSSQRLFGAAESTETGWTLVGLEPLVGLLCATGAIVLFGGLLIWIIDRIGPHRTLRLTLLTVFGALAMWTLRTMFLLNFINAEMATEFMVYAHATPDVKVVLAQIEDISWRTTGTANEVKVAYSEEGAWPFYWYMATRFPNNYYYGDALEAERLLECPVIIAGKPHWGDVEAILGDDYVAHEYKYIWWPIEDYRDLTWERIRAALNDPQMRAALGDIIRNRDYRAYAQLKNPEDPFTLKTWPHRMDMHLYVRRDLAQQVWNYGTETSIDGSTQTPDDYTASERTLSLIFRVQLSNTVGRGVAIAPDGTFYAADTAQHSIWRLSSEGDLLNTWGEYGVAPGQFNEPWDVTVDQLGNVYVADTWNHRIQKFTAEGEFVRSWGRLGQVQAYDPAGNGLFYGPRGIAVGPDGTIYVVDTGNHRVQVFNADGIFLREFGGAGDLASQMNEPVGIAVSETGEVFVADTWNRRVQAFSPEGIYRREWSVPIWSGNPAEKPFLALTDEIVVVGAPVSGRVLAFDHAGTLLWNLHDPENLPFPEGMAVFEDTLYVVDGNTGKLVGYRITDGQ